MTGLLAGTRPTPQTKLGKTLRSLAKKERTEGREPQAHQCDVAAANLDKAALSLGARGERVKSLGAYIAGTQLFRSITGEAYNG